MGVPSSRAGSLGIMLSPSSLSNNSKHRILVNIVRKTASMWASVDQTRAERADREDTSRDGEWIGRWDPGMLGSPAEHHPGEEGGEVNLQQPEDVGQCGQRRLTQVSR